MLASWQVVAGGHAVCVWVFVGKEDEVMERGVVGRFAGVVRTLRGWSGRPCEVVVVRLCSWSRMS